MIPEDRMTVEEVGVYLGMDAADVARMATERSIPSMEVDGQWVFSKKSVDKWRQQRGVRRT